MPFICAIISLNPQNNSMEKALLNYEVVKIMSVIQIRNIKFKEFEHFSQVFNNTIQYNTIGNNRIGQSYDSEPETLNHSKHKYDSWCQDGWTKSVTELY